MIAILLALAAPPLLTAEMALDDGFVTLRLTRGGLPVAKADIKVYTGGEAPTVTGELEEGSGTFPMVGKACLLGITVDGKECDLIPLEAHGKHLSPSRVSLTFGTRPCCQTSAVPREGQGDGGSRRANPMMILLGLGGGVCLLLALFVLLLPRGEAKP